jgi:tetratricopeptide (TPR) repeat protein
MAKKSIIPKKNINQEKKKEISIKKSPVWFYGIMILIPVIFFVVLELVLRYFNYGYDFQQFVSTSNYHKDKIYLNSDLTRKYFFNLKASPSVLPDGFDIQKKDSAFRVFVLGESSAAGWPYVPNASFPRYIKRKLELLYPDNTIEVINCGISAINTYTLRDFVPGIIEQKPDLILIYTGHNEYYGALGVGSTVNLGNSRFLINTFIWAQNFKTFQLLQSSISWLYGVFSSNEKDNNGNETLMSRMIGESLITLNSDAYNSGISQFEGNFDDILSWFKEANVPVIIGNLTCNLKDQKPFVSVKTENLPSAEDIYNSAKEYLSNGNIKKAKELFLYAKELDALRFRAPQQINKIIKNLAQKYSYTMVNIDSVFQSLSPDGIVGYNLTVDHLHPNIEGYRIIANEFYKSMQQNNLVPKGKKNQINSATADSILIANFPFTKLDSTIAKMQLILLTGQYPFAPKGTPNYKMSEYKLKDVVDSISNEVMLKDIRWESAHAKLSSYYFNKGDFEKCIAEMEAVIAERPYYDIPYKNIIVKMVDGNNLDKALAFLVKLHQIKPGYFSYKWLGQVYLKKGNNTEALKYLAEAIKFKEADSQTWYNLSGAYFLNKQNDEAIAALQKSISLNPQNRLAINFYNQLSALNKKK